MDPVDRDVDINSAVEKLMRDAEKDACTRYQKDILDQKAPLDHTSDPIYTINNQAIDPKSKLENKSYQIWSHAIREERLKDVTNIYRRGILFRTPALIALMISIVAAVILLAFGPILGTLTLTITAIVSIIAGATSLITLITLLYESHKFQRFKDSFGIQHVLQAQYYLQENLSNEQSSKQQGALKNIVLKAFTDHSLEMAKSTIPTKRIPK